MNFKVTSGSGRVLAILGLVVLGFVIYNFFPQSAAFWRRLSPQGWGIVSLLLFWLLMLILTGKANPFSLVIGEDGRPSTSKLKPYLWTVVVVYSYVTIYAARYRFGAFNAISDFPPSLLLAMGFSAVTAVTAKGITESKQAKGQLNKPPVESNQVKTEAMASDGEPATPPPPDNTAGPGAIFQDDQGFPDLAKIQTMIWTLIAIVTYLFYVSRAVSGITSLDTAMSTKMPDIDQVLLVLMGLGDAMYIGDKLVTTDVPVISGVAPTEGKVGQEIRLLGSKFGAEQAGSQLTIDRVPLMSQFIVSWSDREIKFKLPEKHPNNTNWSPPQQIKVGVIVGGIRSVNDPTFIVTGV